MKTGVGQRQDTGPGHCAAAVVFVARDVLKDAVVGRVATPHVRHRLFDRFLRHVEARVVRGPQKHQVPSGDRQIRIVFGIPAAIVDVRQPPRSSARSLGQCCI